MIELLTLVYFCASLCIAEFLIVEFGAEDDLKHFRCRWFGWYGAGLSKSFYPKGPLAKGSQNG